jgi:hypothetical protein
VLPFFQQAYSNLAAAANCTAAGDTLSCLRKADAKLLDFAAVLDTAQQVVGFVGRNPSIRVESAKVLPRQRLLLHPCYRWNLYVACEICDRLEAELYSTSSVIQDRPEALLAQGKVNGERIWTTHNFNEVGYFP